VPITNSGAATNAAAVHRLRRVASRVAARGASAKSALSCEMYSWFKALIAKYARVLVLRYIVYQSRNPR
jgi:hypothetical protein